MEIAALEIARMSEEIDGLRDALVEEITKKEEAEARAESLAEKIFEVEMAVREEVFAEMEAQMLGELERWKAGFEVERERGAGFWDRKMEILSSTCLDDDDHDKENESVDLDRALEMENVRLKREIEVLRREAGGRSPTKVKVKSGGRNVLGERERGVLESMENMRISEDGAANPMGSPLKRVRNLTGKIWGLPDGEGEML